MSSCIRETFDFLQPRDMPRLLLYHFGFNIIYIFSKILIVIRILSMLWVSQSGQLIRVQLNKIQIVHICYIKILDSIFGSTIYGTTPRIKHNSAQRLKNPKVIIWTRSNGNRRVYIYQYSMHCTTYSSTAIKSKWRKRV